MNIGIDIRPLMSPVRSGVGEYSYELLNAIFIIDKTNQYFLFYNSCTDVSEFIPNWKQDNISYIKTDWPNKMFNASAKLFSFPKIDATIEKRVKFAQNKKLDYFFSSNFNFTPLSKSAKTVLTVHDLSFEFFPEFYSLKQRLWHQAINPKRQCQRADIILVPSENTRRDLMDLYKISPEKINVLYPGTNCYSEQDEGSFQKKKLEIQKKYSLPEKFILFLGTVEPRKNILGLIAAFEQAYSKFSNPHSLIIAGHKGWRDKKIYKKFQFSPYKDKIKFIGSIGPEEKQTLYSLASLFVYPSFYEGFGFPVVEAMSAGTPVITSNRSSLPEIAGNAACLINPNRPTEIANAMVMMLTNQKLSERLTVAGLGQVEKFNWEKTARNFLKILT